MTDINEIVASLEEWSLDMLPEKARRYERNWGEDKISEMPAREILEFLIHFKYQYPANFETIRIFIRIALLNDPVFGLMTFRMLSRAGYWLENLMSDVYYVEENDILYVRSVDNEDYLREFSDEEDINVEDPSAQDDSEWNKTTLQSLTEKGNFSKWALWAHKDTERWVMLTTIANDDDYQP